MRFDKIENIPNTFAPRCRNKFLSLYSLYFMISRGYMRYEEPPKEIRQILEEYLKIRRRFFWPEQLPKEVQQLFDEYLKSEKTCSAETRDDLK